METQKSGSSLSFDWSINQIVFQDALSVFQPYKVGFAEFNLKTLKQPVSQDVTHKLLKIFLFQEEKY